MSEVCVPVYAVPGACVPMRNMRPMSEASRCVPQEEMALQLINFPGYKLQPHRHSYLRSSIILILSLFMVLRGSMGGLETEQGQLPEVPPS